MIVTCDVVRCGYYTSGYCGKPVLRILQNGACGYLYKQDLTPRETAVAAKPYKERLEIIEVEVKEYDGTGKDNDENIDQNESNE